MKYYYEVYRKQTYWFFYDADGNYINKQQFYANGASDVDYVSIDSDSKLSILQKFSKMKDAKEFLKSFTDIREEDYHETYDWRKVELY